MTTKCSNKWTDQAQCGDTAADGKPNSKKVEEMSNCWANKGMCPHQVEDKT